MIHALDFSAGARDITPAWAQKQKEDGYSLMISQLWGGWSKNDHAEKALTICKGAGHQIAGYTYLTENYPGAYHVQRAKEAAGERWGDLKWLAIDCEFQGLTLGTIDEAVAEAENEGVHPIIYTGEWFWRGSMGNPQMFNNMQLWTTYYNGTLDLGDVPLYGGWGKVYGKQLKGTTYIDGIGCDLNVFEDDEEKTEPPTYPDWIHEFWNQAKSLGGGTLAENIERSIRIMKGEEEL